MTPTTHDALVLHSVTTVFLAGAMWTIQLTIIPVLARSAEADWPPHVAIYRRVFRALFWPVVAVEAGTGILVALVRPPGIPGWVHAVNLALLVCAWSTIPLTRLVVGHRLLDRYDPRGVVRFGRLNWIRVVVWSVRAAMVVAMIRLVAAAFGR